MNWIAVKDRLPQNNFKNEIEVIGYNSNWIHPDFNPLGQRICCKDDEGWYSAKWNSTHDCYISIQPEDNDNPTHWMSLFLPPEQ